MFLRSFSKQAAKIKATVVNEVAKQRFSVTLPDGVATLVYKLSGKKISLVRTDVPKVFQGQGIGKLIAKEAFDYALKNNLDVVIQCHFLEGFYKQNKENYKDLKITIDLIE